MKYGGIPMHKIREMTIKYGLGILPGGWYKNLDEGESNPDSGETGLPLGWGALAPAGRSSGVGSERK